MPLPAVSAVFRGVSCRRLPLGCSTTFLVPVACPAPAVELCCWVCGVLGVSLGFLPGVVLFLQGLRLALLPYRRLPLGVATFSNAVCLAYCCAGGVGWAATLPLCYQCFSCASWLAGVHWVLHPVSGGSHRGCDCSLDDCVAVLFDSTCL